MFVKLIYLEEILHFSIEEIFNIFWKKIKIIEI